MADWLATTFGIDPGFARGVLFVFTAAILFAIVWAIVAFVRGLTSGRLGRARRNRQPRLAVMDTTDIDHRRQLVLVRRDHVEHLLLIGGPVDVVVEENIIRNAVGDVHGRSTRVRKINGDEDEGDTASTEFEPPAASPAPVPRPVTPARPAGSAAAPAARAPAPAPAARPQPPVPADTGEARRWRQSPQPAGETGSPAARPVTTARPVPPKPVAARPPQPARTPPPARPPVRTGSDQAPATPQQPVKTGPAGEVRQTASAAPAFVPHPSSSETKAPAEPADEATPSAAPAASGPAPEAVKTPPEAEAPSSPAPQPAPDAGTPAPATDTGAPADTSSEETPKGDDDLDLDDEMARLLRGVGDR